jgi:hypothetical protein
MTWLDAATTPIGAHTPFRKGATEFQKRRRHRGEVALRQTLSTKITARLIAAAVASTIGFLLPAPHACKETGSRCPMPTAGTARVHAPQPGIVSAVHVLGAARVAFAYLQRLRPRAVRGRWGEAQGPAVANTDTHRRARPMNPLQEDRARCTASSTSMESQATTRIGITGARPGWRRRFQLGYRRPRSAKAVARPVTAPDGRHRGEGCGHGQ